MKKTRYRFLLRPLTGPEATSETQKLEAGPFTPLEASAFGQQVTASRTMTTGVPWVCNYAPVVEYAPPWPPTWLFLAVFLVFVLFVVPFLLWGLP